MTPADVPADLRRQVRADAAGRCGYCHTPEVLIGMPLEFEHLYPEAYGGLTVRENLWLACTRCNGFKGDRVDAIDRRQVSVCRPSADARSSGPSTSRGCRTVCESLVLPSSAVRQWRCYA